MKPAIILSLLALSACAGTPTVNANCPVVRQWSPADEQAFVAAERALPRDNPIWLKIEDEQRLRDWARACEAAR